MDSVYSGLKNRMDSSPWHPREQTTVLPELLSLFVLTIFFLACIIIWRLMKTSCCPAEAKRKTTAGYSKSRVPGTHPQPGVWLVKSFQERRRLMGRRRGKKMTLSIAFLSENELSVLTTYCLSLLSQVLQLICRFVDVSQSDKKKKKVHPNCHISNIGRLWDLKSWLIIDGIDWESSGFQFP